MNGLLEQHFFRTPEGFGVALPFALSVQEATLPGNCFVIESSTSVDVLVIYDDSTRTGGIFCAVEGWEDQDGRPNGAWTMWQPMLRERFFGEAGPVRLYLANMGLGEAALPPAWIGGKLESDSRVIG